MVTSIKAAEEQLKSYNRTLTEKVEARTRDLHIKNVKLEETLKQIKEMQHQLILQELVDVKGTKLRLCPFSI